MPCMALRFSELAMASLFSFLMNILGGRLLHVYGVGTYGHMARGLVARLGMVRNRSIC